MAGLIGAPAPDQMQPQAAPDQAQAAPGDGNGEQMASPEEQQVYDDLVSRAYMLIFDDSKGKPEIRKNILDGLDDGDPKEGLATVAASVFARVLQVAHQSGIEVPDDVKEAAGTEVFETLAQISTNAGNYDFMSDDQAFNAAYLAAVDQLRQMETSAGTLNQDQVQQHFGDLVQADKDGRLAGIMQGLGGDVAQTA